MLHEVRGVMHRLEAIRMSFLAGRNIRRFVGFLGIRSPFISAAPASGPLLLGALQPAAIVAAAPPWLDHHRIPIFHIG